MKCVCENCKKDINNGILCHSYQSFIKLNDDKLKKIIKLDLSYEGLTSKYLNDNFINQLNKCTNLNRLYLSYNNIITIPKHIFNNLNKLIELGLDHNKITIFTSNIFDSLVNLKELFLYNNELLILPNNIFNKLVNLKEQ